MTKLSDIETEIASERDALRQSLDALEARLAPSQIVDDIAGLVLSNGDDIAKAAMGVARENPLAVSLIAGGLAWLAAGALKPAKPRAVYDTRPTEPVSGLRQPAPDMTGFDDRVAAAAAASIQTQPQTGGDTMTHDNIADHASTETGLKARAYQSVEALKARLNDGLDSLPDSAKDRILAARLAAIDAQQEVERRAKVAVEGAKRSAQDNPLLIGAIALAAGAALGAALPRTAAEDRVLGGHRDRLFDEANRVFHEETAKLKAAAETAVSEGQATLKAAVKDTAA